VDISSGRATPSAATSRMLVARLDRLDVWSLSYLFIGIIGFGFLFTFYDITDINVTWLQTCLQLRPGCTPANAGDPLKTIVLLNLLGYAVGTILLSPIGDRVGRKKMLMLTLVLTGVGSLYCALAVDYTNFVIARTLTGVGIGADLALVNAYISEMAPKNGRAKYASTIFSFSAVGAFLGGLIGVILSTPSAAWPQGLPFAIAGPDLQGSGWRWTYGIGALLAIVGLVLRFELPESPRWSIGHGRLPEAEVIVADMERRASKKGPLREPTEGDWTEHEPTKAPLRDLVSQPTYLHRIFVLLPMWIFAYATVYGFSAGFTVVLAALTSNGKPVYSPSEAGLIVVLGLTGIIVAALFSIAFSEKLDRRWWMPIGATITLAGCFITGLGGSHLYVAFVGAAVIFFGFNVWVGPTYALSAELFPTRARGTGFALVDGVGHVGGAMSLLIIVPIIGHLSPLTALIVLGAFQAVAALLLQLAPRSRNVPLNKLSP
jgi:MFS transporter, putative metabolite:H+ symporter